MSEISFELIEEVGKERMEELQAAALRTIRHEHGRAEGLAKLNQIQGIEDFIAAIRRAAGSSYYRQAGMVHEKRKPMFTRRTKKQMEIERAKQRTSNLREIKRVSAGGEL